MSGQRIETAWIGLDFSIKKYIIIKLEITLRNTDMQIRLLNSVMREQFGKKMYKLAMDGGMTCPNRDGTVGCRGCIFCSDRGSGDFAEKYTGDIRAQLDKAKLLVRGKAGDCGYIAYFQSFTNTYAPYEKLRTLFYETVSQPDVDILSVATRPDCLPSETIELLAELNNIKPVWVELGLQTVNEDIAKYIRRGYDLPVYDNAVNRLKERGIAVIAHMIIGLPGEEREEIIDTARYIGKSGADGIKFQLLHVLRGTDLALEYKQGKFECLSLKKYAEILADCIRIIPPDMVVHRLTGDGAKRDLIAPLWSGDKKRVLNYIHRYLRDNGVIQGEHFE